jgi:hypothetical protein
LQNKNREDKQITRKIAEDRQIAKNENQVERI